MLDFIRNWLKPTRTHIHGTNFFFNTDRRIMMVTFRQKFTERVKTQLLTEFDNLIAIED